MKNFLSLLFGISLAIFAAHTGAALPASSCMGGSSALASPDCQGVPPDSRTFLQSAFQSGLSEIQLAQLAVKKSANSDIRAFAQQMIDDRSQSNRQIAALARQKNISLPDAPSAQQQATADELLKISGRDFDLAYMDLNIFNRFIDLHAFQIEGSDGIDPEIMRLAAGALPALSEHFQRAKAIGDEIKPSFLFGALRDGALELQLSDLALTKSSNAEVRAYAQRMILEHSQQNAQIMELAQKKSLGLSNLLSPTQKLLLDELRGMSEPDFDKTYMTFNVFAHQKAAREFKTESTQESDADIKSFASDAVPAMTEHLELAQEIARKLSK